MILNYKDLKSTIMPNKSNTIETLRTSGLRPTKQRVQLAKFLFDRDKTFHFNVEDLHKTINLIIIYYPFLHLFFCNQSFIFTKKTSFNQRIT